MPTKPLSHELALQAVNVLAAHQGNVSEAARALGISRTTLQSRLKVAAERGILAGGAAPSPGQSKLPDDVAYLQARRDKEQRETAARVIKGLGSKVDQLETALSAALSIKEGAAKHTISPRAPGESEAVAIWLASDWHVEEHVTLAQTNGVNEFNLDVAKERADNYFRNALRLTDMTAKDVKVGTVVLAVLGDMITGHLHPQAVETNLLPPVEAAIFAQKLLASGIQFVLDNSDYDIVFVGKYGNHSRTTKFSEFGSEAGHSYEHFMYCSLRDMFKDESRISFVIEEGAHTYIDVLGYTIRFLHGHDIKFGGGVGGITIPVTKALNMWDRLRRADLTVFGHFHQRLDGGHWLCNGSLIGYNSFALSIKASPEKPQQQFCLLDAKRGKTIVAPILVEE